MSSPLRKFKSPIQDWQRFCFSNLTSFHATV